MKYNINYGTSGRMRYTQKKVYNSYNIFYFFNTYNLFDIKLKTNNNR